MPGAGKNLLDWCIGGGELSGKPVGWINCSDRGAAGAYAELATVLRYADTRIVEAACARVVVSRSSLDADHRITDPALRAELVAVARAAGCPSGRARKHTAGSMKNLTGVVEHRPNVAETGLNGVS